MTSLTNYFASMMSLQPFKMTDWAAVLPGKIHNLWDDISNAFSGKEVPYFDSLSTEICTRGSFDKSALAKVMGIHTHVRRCLNITFTKFFTCWAWFHIWIIVLHRNQISRPERVHCMTDGDRHRRKATWTLIPRLLFLGPSMSQGYDKKDCRLFSLHQLYWSHESSTRMWPWSIWRCQHLVRRWYQHPIRRWRHSLHHTVAQLRPSKVLHYLPEGSQNMFPYPYLLVWRSKDHRSVVDTPHWSGWHLLQKSYSCDKTSDDNVTICSSIYILQAIYYNNFAYSSVTLWWWCSASCGR